MKPSYGIEGECGAECFPTCIALSELSSPPHRTRGVAPEWYVDAPSGIHCTDTKNGKRLRITLCRGQKKADKLSYAINLSAVNLQTHGHVTIEMTCHSHSELTWSGR